MTSEKEEQQAEEEREKVIEEWSEIELRYKDGPPSMPEENNENEKEHLGENTRIHDSALHLDYLREHLQHQPTEKILQNELWRRVFEMNYENAKIAAKKEVQDENGNNSSKVSDWSAISSLLFIRRCVCRPACEEVEPIKNERLTEQRLLLLALSKTPFSAACIEHWRLLCEFYKRAAIAAIGDVPEASQCPRTGSHWQIVGFQGVDPSTDLRGVGLLGLLQLHYVASEGGLTPSELSTILKLSRDEKQNFPFACIGLNFTSMIASRLRTGELNAIANSQSSFLNAINLIFRGCFIVFYHEWLSYGRTIIDTQAALQGVEKVLKRDPSALLIQKMNDDPKS